MKLSTFIENLSIFFSAYLLEIVQAQLKNSNHDILLSTWLVFIENYPKGLVISICHFPIQIKI